jgi:predicted nucleic acid-binding protein
VGVAPTFLLDKCAFARIATERTVAEVLRPLMAEGEVAVHGVLALEAGYSVRNRAEHDRLRSVLRSMPQVAVEPVDWDRAFDVQAELAGLGQHRSARLPDLLLAATAERCALTVLHYDADFDLVSRLTSQPTRWVVPRGSLPTRRPGG